VYIAKISRFPQASFHALTERVVIDNAAEHFDAQGNRLFYIHGAIPFRILSLKLKQSFGEFVIIHIKNPPVKRFKGKIRKPVKIERCKNAVFALYDRREIEMIQSVQAPPLHRFVEFGIGACDQRKFISFALALRFSENKHIRNILINFDGRHGIPDKMSPMIFYGEYFTFGAFGRCAV
jgi:hypothetical protein